MDEENKVGSHKNIWHGIGRKRIEIPKPVIKSKVQNNPLLSRLYLCSMGYYPKAEKHYTYRKKGLPENFLFYCVDGKGWYQLEDKKYEVGTNEFFILPQNTEHAYGSSNDDPWTIYWVHFSGDSLPAFNKLQVVQKHFKPAYIRISREVTESFNKMMKALELGFSLDNLLFANICLNHFISMFIYNQKHFPDIQHDKQDSIDNAILYMQEHINDNILLTDLCKHFNYSSSRFSSLFKQKTGYAPIDYFIQLKMQKATQQLDFTDQSIKQIAMSMGFDDPYYFSKRFRKVIGMSPKKYRMIKKD